MLVVGTSAPLPHAAWPELPGNILHASLLGPLSPSPKAHAACSSLAVLESFVHSNGYYNLYSHAKLEALRMAEETFQRPSGGGKLSTRSYASTIVYRPCKRITLRRDTNKISQVP